MLTAGGAPGEALPLLGEARRRLEVLVAAGDTNAAGAVSMALTENGDCLRELGRLDEAAAMYEAATRRDESLGDRRGVAVNKVQLGTVRLREGRYGEALTAYEGALRTFEVIGEPRSVASIWHQIGRVHQEGGRQELAKRAYRQSLAIKVQQKDLAGEAYTLSQLGILYHQVGRSEEAVICNRQAADIYIRLRDQRTEGRTHHNLANMLFKLGRYDEARRELLSAIECATAYGHATHPWATWALLRYVGWSVGNVEAATRARQKAIKSYLSYRKDGGYTTSPAAQLCGAVSEAISQGDTSGVQQDLAEMLGEGVPAQFEVLITKLQAVERGERNPALANDPPVDFDNAAELRLPLESLEGR